MFGVTTEVRKLRRGKECAESTLALNGYLRPLGIVQLELRDDVDDQLVTVQFQLRLQSLYAFFRSRSNAVSANDAEAIRREHYVERWHSEAEGFGDDALLHHGSLHSLECWVFGGNDVTAKPVSCHL